VSIDPSDASVPPPIHETPEDSHEEQPDESQDDLAHAELAEALAARQVSLASPKTPHRTAKARSRHAGLAFLHLEDLPSDKGSGNGPLAVWIIVQLAAIGAAAGRWKFWATEGVGNSPSIELLALHLLLIVQLVVSTLIFPILLEGWANLAWTIATAVVFQAIAWVMTGVTPMSAVLAGGFVVTWIVGLAVWRAALTGAAGTMLIRLLLSLVVLGWPILVYLHGEFSANGSGTFAGIGGGGPLLIALEQLSSTALMRPTWATILILGGSGGVVWLTKRLMGIHPFHDRQDESIPEPRK
jgi:hypothetical protein